LPLEVERRQNLTPDHTCPKAGRVTVDRRDHEIGDRLAMVVPGAPVGEFRGDMLAKKARDMLARRREAVVQRRGDQSSRACCQARSM
jgi:hypothetical protein